MHLLCTPTMEFIKSRRIPEVLYACIPPDICLKELAETKCMSPPTETSGTKLINMVLTVTENRKGYNQRQFENE